MFMMSRHCFTLFKPNIEFNPITKQSQCHYSPLIVTRKMRHREVFDTCLKSLSKSGAELGFEPRFDYKLHPETMALNRKTRTLDQLEVPGSSPYCTND